MGARRGWLTGGCAGVVTCPVCARALVQKTERSLGCSRGHAFDVAREGYVNLMAAGHGLTRRSGDDAEQLRARRRFLHRGHYRPLAERLEQLARGHARHGDPAGADRADAPRVVLDAGCGEGHYIGRLGQLAATGAGACVLGFDVSKAAVRLAARSHPHVRFFVNDVAGRICVADAAVDLLLNVFAPRNPDEFARVVRPGGRLLAVVPGAAHLGELRRLLPLLDVEPGKEDRTVARLASAFEPARRERLDYRLTLDRDDLFDLLRMTPNFWHLVDAELDRAGRLAPIELTVDFTLLEFRRSESR